MLECDLSLADAPICLPFVQQLNDASRDKVESGTRRVAVSGPYRHIGAKTTDDVLVLTIEVEQVKDYAVAEELRYELIHALKSREVNRVVLDLHNMTFITSLACVAFIGVKQAIKDAEGRVVLCNMSDFIHKVFSAKRLLAKSPQSGNVAFESAESLQEAIELLAAPN